MSDITIIDDAVVSFTTHYSYSNPETYGEENDEESMTDTSGYIDPTDQLADMIESGQILTSYRETYYDEDSEDDGVPLYARQNLDPTDVDKSMDAFVADLRARSQARQAAELEKTEKSAESASTSQQEATTKE